MRGRRDEDGRRETGRREGRENERGKVGGRDREAVKQEKGRERRGYKGGRDRGKGRDRGDRVRMKRQRMRKRNFCCFSILPGDGDRRT